MGEANQRTKAIQQTVNQLRDDSAAVQQQAKEVQESLEKDPAAVVSVSLVATKSPNLNAGKWQLTAMTIQPVMPGATNGRSFDPTLQVVFDAAGPKASTVNFTERQLVGTMEQRGASLDELGNDVIVCFTGLEPWHGQKVRWAATITPGK